MSDYDRDARRLRDGFGSPGRRNGSCRGVPWEEIGIRWYKYKMILVPQMGMCRCGNEIEVFQ